MVNRLNANLSGEIDKLNESDADAALSYNSELLSSKRNQPKDNPVNDELIVSLANAHENKRARQVTEWEKLRRQGVQHLA